MSVLSISPLESVLLCMCILYIVVPMPTPSFMIPLINNNVGLAVSILVALYMLLNFSPILAVVVVFSIYTLLDRTSKTFNIMNTPTKTIPAKSEKKKVTKMKKSGQTTKEKTLEEQIVDKMAPVGQSPVSEKVSSTFKPLNDKVKASMY